MRRGSSLVPDFLWLMASAGRARGTLEYIVEGIATIPPFFSLPLSLLFPPPSLVEGLLLLADPRSPVHCSKAFQRPLSGQLSGGDFDTMKFAPFPSPSFLFPPPFSTLQGHEGNAEDVRKPQREKSFFSCAAFISTDSFSAIALRQEIARSPLSPLPFFFLFLLARRSAH